MRNKSGAEVWSENRIACYCWYVCHGIECSHHIAFIYNACNQGGTPSYVSGGARPGLHDSARTITFLCSF